MYKDILLDTCALLWLTTGHERLSQSMKTAINQAENIYVSAISGFEIGLKQAKGKLILPMQADVWFVQVLAFHRISVLELDTAICIGSTQLEFHHQDPCDRFIIATALQYDLAIATADTVFNKYPVHLIA